MKTSDYVEKLEQAKKRLVAELDREVRACRQWLAEEDDPDMRVGFIARIEDLGRQRRALEYTDVGLRRELAEYQAWRRPSIAT